MRRGTFFYPEVYEDPEYEDWGNPFEEEEEVIEVIKNKKEFYVLFKQYKDKLIILYFAATWMTEPSYDDVKKAIIKIEIKNEDKLKFFEVDCDNEDTAFLMKRYKVLCSPTFVFIKHGKRLENYVAGGTTLTEKIKGLNYYIDRYKDVKPKKHF